MDSIVKLFFCCMLSISGVSSNYQYNQNKPSTLSCDCGWTNKENRKIRSIGATQTLPNEYPWAASLLCGLKKEHYCAGTIITEWHVLTGACCTIGLTHTQISVCVGAHDATNCNNKEIEKNAVIIKVEEIITKSFYNSIKKRNDISILVTSSKMIFNEFIGPVCFPEVTKTYSELINQELKFLGFGGFNKLLKKITMRVVPSNDCKKYYPKIKESQNICTYSTEGHLCDGDRGSPFVTLDPLTTRFTIIALHSKGPDMCITSENHPSINTNVSYFRNWVIKKVKDKEGASLCMKI